MDAVRNEVIGAMQTLASEVYDADIRVTQDVAAEKMFFEDAGGNYAMTTMNCAMNSSEATVRQFCGHIRSMTLMSYEDGYFIGG